MFQSVLLQLKSASFRAKKLKCVHFLHVGKTGGTAIKNALQGYPISGPYAIFLHGHKVRLRDIPLGDGFFFFVRDPISRFVSGFYSRYRQGQPWHFNPWSDAEKEAFQYFLTPNQLAIGLSSEDNLTRQKAVKAMQSIGHVRSSYWDWFTSEAYFRSRQPNLFFIGFQESMNDDYNKLLHLLSMPSTVELPSDEVQAHKTPNTLDKLLTQSAIENLRQWYARDFHFVSLCREALQAQSSWELTR